ncbi:MAG TPA: hypothetical protein VNT99_02120 [Methylomirabilota bacterium]|nr:hypothetical protein [Methylomirabilota bacterium]
MRKLYVHKTAVGAFYIAEQDGRFHPLYRNESLGSYATSQQAVDDLIGGRTMNVIDGLDTASLGIPNLLGEWARLLY